MDTDKTSRITVLRIAAGCGCTGPYPGRLKDLEKTLLSGEYPRTLPDREALISLVESAVSPPGDPFGSAGYRSRVNGVKIADLLIECREALK